MTPEVTIKIAMGPEEAAAVEATAPPPVSLEEVVTSGPPMEREGAPAPVPLGELEATRAVLEDEPPLPIPLEQLGAVAVTEVAPAPAPAEQLPEAAVPAVGPPPPAPLEDLEAAAAEEPESAPGPEEGPHATPGTGGAVKKTTRKSTARPRKT